MDFHIIGKRIIKTDSLAKVTDQAKYTVDLSFPVMLIGKMLRSTRHHAWIRRLDIFGALRVPNVKALIPGKDLLPVVYGFVDRGADMTFSP